MQSWELIKGSCFKLQKKYRFSIMIIWDWKHLRKSRHRKCSLPSSYLPKSRASIPLLKVSPALSLPRKTRATIITGNGGKT